VAQCTDQVCTHASPLARASLRPAPPPDWAGAQALTPGLEALQEGVTVVCQGQHAAAKAREKVGAARAGGGRAKAKRNCSGRVAHGCEMGAARQRQRKGTEWSARSRCWWHAQATASLWRSITHARAAGRPMHGVALFGLLGPLTWHRGPPHSP
jgi:hypothetical protein